MFDNKQKAVAGALVGATIAFLGAILAGLQSAGENAGFGDLNAATWVTAVIAFLSALGLTGGTVYAVTNKKRNVA